MMQQQLSTGALLLACASLATAQYGYGGPGGYNGGNGDSGNPFANGRNNAFANLGALLSDKQKIVIAHGVLASAAFVFFFPVGAILIRLGSFRGLWLVHAAVQAFAYLLYIAAFGIGVYMTSHVGLTNQAHPIIGIVLFILLFFQPVLGFLHHIMFKKHSRRVIWSYGHIWLGRIAITLGIINGGLGLQLAQRTRVFAPSTGDIIAYSVVAAVMWLVYVGSAIFGEIKRRKAQRNLHHTQKGATAPGAPNGVGEYYRNQDSGPVYA